MDKNKVFFTILLSFIISLVAMFMVDSEVTRNYLKLINLILIYILYYFHKSVTDHIKITESGLKIGANLIDVKKIISIKIYEDTITFGGTYLTDPEKWAKYLQIKFYEINGEGNEITKRIDEKPSLEEQLKKWSEENGLNYSRIPRGKAY